MEVNRRGLRTALVLMMTMFVVDDVVAVTVVIVVTVVVVVLNVLHAENCATATTQAGILQIPASASYSQERDGAISLIKPRPPPTRWLPCDRWSHA